jgi:hypothetical protein
MKNLLSFDEFVNEQLNESTVNGDTFIEGLANIIANELGVTVTGTAHSSGNEKSVDGIQLYNVSSDYNMSIDYDLLSKKSKKSQDVLVKIIDKAVKVAKKTVGDAKVKRWSPKPTSTVFSVSAKSR